MDPNPTQLNFPVLGGISHLKLSGSREPFRWVPQPPLQSSKTELKAQLNLPSPLQWYIQKNIRGPFYTNSIFNHDTHKNLKESPTSRVVDLALNQSQTLETNILDP